MASQVSVGTGASALLVESPAIAASSTPDPIFELIERHRRACVSMFNALRAASDAEETIPESRRSWEGYRYDEPDPPENCPDDPAWLKSQADLRDAYHAEEEAIVALLTTPPTTLAGLAALLKRAGEPNYPDQTDLYEETVLGWAVSCDREDVSEAAASFLERLADHISKARLA
jgi:hypothetical protein